MSYLYNLFQGSLDDLARRWGAVPDSVKGDAMEAPEALRALIMESWEFASELQADWHDQDELIERLSQLQPPASQLACKLLESPPLGIQPYDFGFIGCMVSAEVAQLREALEAPCGSLADAISADPIAACVDVPLAEQPDPLFGAACVLSALRPVTHGMDVALVLG